MMKHILSTCQLSPPDLKKRVKESAKQTLHSRKKNIHKATISDSDEVEDNPPAISTPLSLSASATNSSNNEKQVSASAKNSSNDEKQVGQELQRQISGSMVSKCSMKPFVDTMTAKHKTQIDEALARAIYACGLPFSLLENPYWQSAFQLIKPSYKLPSAYYLANPLLEAKYSRVMDAARSKINSALCLARMTDGWTNIRGEGIVNFIITTPDPVFFRSVVPGKERETASYISEQLIKVIQDSGVDAKKFFILITDNAAAMKAAWGIVTREYPYMIATACSGHYLNLFLTDVMKQPSVIFFYKQVKSVIKLVKRKHVILATFQEKQQSGVSLKLPPKTRWSYVVLSLFSVLINKTAIQETFISEKLKEVIPRDMRMLVLDEDLFWVNIKTTYDMLKPIRDAVQKVEGDKATLSIVPEITHNTNETVIPLLPQSLLNNEEQENVSKALTERTYHCNQEVHFAANLLDQRFKGSKLHDFEIHSAMDFISSQCEHLNLDKGNVLADLAQYRTATGFYSQEYLWKAADELDPVTWWSGLCASQPLQALGSRLLSVPPTSAASERDWSVHGAIHTKSRNRLHNDSVEKVKAVKQNLRYSVHGILPKNKVRSECDEIELGRVTSSLSIDLLKDEDVSAEYSSSDSESDGEKEASDLNLSLSSEDEDDVPLKLLSTKVSNK